MVEKLKLDKLQCRRTLDKVSMMYRIVNNLVDIAPPLGLYQRPIRTTKEHPMKLQVPHSRTAMYLHSFPSTIRLWNQLSTETILSPSLQTFQTSAGKCLSCI